MSILSDFIRASYQHEEHAREDGLHPSSISRDPYCLRRHWFERNEPIQHTIDTQLIFDIGHVVHDLYQEKYLKDVIHSCETRICFYHNGTKIVGAIDGLLSFNGEDHIVELKSMDPGGWEMLRYAKQSHINQVHFYMFALKITKAIIGYINKSNGQLKEFIIEYDERLMQSLLRLVESIAEVDLTNDLPLPHKSCTPKSTMRQWCPYKDVCFGRLNEKEDF